ncbi:MAG: LysM peptidoglycan-binding domain-containing protein [Candidatus Kapabacteria bacterium]|nr:LysM peptidoglycan-binding domain-containing protein [Candidatus Kapabacteria bacterium]
MKKILFLLIFMFLSMTATFAADAVMPPDSKADELLTFDEANLRIQSIQARVNELTQRYNTLKDGNAELKKQLDETIAALKKCNEDLYTLIKATKEDVDKFAQQLGNLEGKVRQMKGLSNDELSDRRAEVEAMEKELNTMRQNKIAVLPQFFQRVIDLGNEIKTLYREHSKPKNYIVGKWSENKDCLWNIAGKIEILGDPFMWPKIWQANTQTIRNPDIIRPGQELILPQKGPKTTDEMKAEKKYWRNKKAKEDAAANPAPNATAAPAAHPAAAINEPKEKKASTDAQPKKGK